MYVCVHIYIYIYIYVIMVTLYIYIYTQTCLIMIMVCFLYVRVNSHSDTMYFCCYCFPVPKAAALHPVRIARIRCPRFVPRVGLPRNLCLIGCLMAALRFSKGWVRILDCELGVSRAAQVAKGICGCLPHEEAAHIYIYIYIYMCVDLSLSI